MRRPPDLPAPPEVDWRTFFRRFDRDYRVSAGSADHVTIIGPTGTGKTTLALELSRLRRYVVALGCKPADPELAAGAARLGYWRTPSGELPSPARHPRVLVWPRYRSDADLANQKAQFRLVLDTAFTVGRWHLLIDEVPHLHDLGLTPPLRRHLRMGRAMASGLILCAQRPRNIPLEAISGAQHLFIFGTSDDEDLKRLGGMNGVSSAAVRHAVAGLGRDYRFLYVNTRTGTMVVSRFDR